MRSIGRGWLLSVLLLGPVLCAVIGLEIADRRSPQADTRIHAAAPLSEAKASLTEPPNQRAAWLSEILARPLFSPDRRPVEVAARSLRGLPRLAGIVVSGSQRIAIFAAPSGGAPLVVEAGARVGAYDVRNVADTGVTVVGPGGTTVVRPIFDPNRKVPVPTGPRPPFGLSGQVRPAR